MGCLQEGQGQARNGCPSTLVVKPAPWIGTEYEYEPPFDVFALHSENFYDSG